MEMKVILTENISTLGQIGQIVNVAPGYGRNFLLPQGFAMEATGKNVGELEHRIRMLERKRERVRQETLSIAEKLNQVRLTLNRKVVEENKLYGSVNVAEIHAMLGELGFVLERRDILLDQPIKQLGEFTIPVRLDSQITANVTVTVAKEA